MEHGISINPIAFLVIANENVRLIPIEHSSAIDRILDYVPDLMEKANNMINNCMYNKNKQTEQIINKMKNKEDIKKPEEVVKEVEFDELVDEDDEI